VNSHEIFSTVDPSVVSEILDWFRENDRDVYKTIVSTLATNRKLRPVFVQKKPLPEQYAWIQKTLQIRACDSVGEQLLQTYLMSAQQSMLGMFCDGMSIEHDGKGSVTGSLPTELDQAKLDETVEKLADVFDPKIFAIYLHCFNMQVPGGYPNLSEKLASDDRLKLA
jgi:L-cysteine desulfidase